MDNLLASMHPDSIYISAPLMRLSEPVVELVEVPRWIGAKGHALVLVVLEKSV